MNLLSVHMLGHLYLRQNDVDITGLGTKKARELLCYLLIHRQRSHAREALANVFWSNTSTGQSRANLRRTLWQLQTALNEQIAEELVQVNAGWVQINPQASIWIDVGVVEQTFVEVRESCGKDMSDEHAQMAVHAVELYRGELLDGCYQDWCLFERERLHNIYLSLLDRLVSYCEYHQEYERGLAYGAELLRHDRTREQAHCHLMRLFVRAGNRASALRQYERCVAVLANELEIGPSSGTIDLYERIRDNLPLNDEPGLVLAEATVVEDCLKETLRHLRDLQSAVTKISRALEVEIEQIEALVRRTTR